MADTPRDCSALIKGVRTTNSSSYTTFGVHMCTNTKTKGAVKSGSSWAVSDTAKDCSTRIKGVRTNRTVPVTSPLGSTCAPTPRLKGL
ncbi:hypothetical protein RRG08_006565 [Elysia crispata]|uniref:Uncharacterized protein n=1 Tax=Elysia crispata TaxID=231223 RepID=A0AAE0Z8P8_9GAST|nr:hypothetical protein RRG08_006565 [Elysia crispata]